MAPLSSGTFRSDNGAMTPKLYAELAEWWPLLSAPEDYAEEAATWLTLLKEAGNVPARTLLELGSGGGNNASFLKRHFEMTLVDLSEGMLAHSRRLNPESEHHVGDMRTVRLGRTFDRVFIHDAVCYMTTPDDLRQAFETAAAHLRPGGGLVVVPDAVRETFAAGTEHGGHDGDGRGLRYLEWTWDPDPADCTYTVDYVYVMREGAGMPHVEIDRHVEGLFGRDEWLGALRDAGFEPDVKSVTFEDGTITVEAFVARLR